MICYVNCVVYNWPLYSCLSGGQSYFLRFKQVQFRVNRSSHWDLSSLQNNWQKFPQIIFWEEGLSVWMPTCKIVSGMVLDTLYYPMDSWKYVVSDRPWLLHKCPRRQQKEWECPRSSRCVGICMGVGVICLWLGLGARTGAGQEGGHWRSWRTLRFAPSSDVCTWYGIKLDFSNYQMHQLCREGRKNKGKYHRDWREWGKEC